MRRGTSLDVVRDVEPISFDGPKLPWSLTIAVADLMAAVERLCELPAAADLELGPLLSATEALDVAIGELDAARGEIRHIAREAHLAANAMAQAVRDFYPAEAPVHFAALEVERCARAVAEELLHPERDAPATELTT